MSNTTLTPAAGTAATTSQRPAVFVVFVFGTEVWKLDRRPMVWLQPAQEMIWRLDD